MEEKSIKNYYEKIPLYILEEIIACTRLALKVQEEIYTWRSSEV